MNEPWSGVVATFANRHSINRQQKWPLNYILVVGGDVLRFVLSDSLPPTTTGCGEGCSCRSVGCPFCLRWREKMEYGKLLLVANLALSGWCSLVLSPSTW